MGKTSTEEYLLLDYPEEGERITVPKYMIRIEASCQAHRVQVSVDRGPWRSCRAWAGFWWYEWSGYLPGRHQVIGRVIAQDGRAVVSKVRRFLVDLDDSEESSE